MFTIKDVERIANAKSVCTDGRLFHTTIAQDICSTTNRESEIHSYWFTRFKSHGLPPDAELKSTSLHQSLVSAKSSIKSFLPERSNSNIPWLQRCKRLRSSSSWLLVVGERFHQFDVQMILILNIRIRFRR